MLGEPLFPGHCVLVWTLPRFVLCLGLSGVVSCVHALCGKCWTEQNLDQQGSWIPILVVPRFSLWLEAKQGNLSALLFSRLANEEHVSSLPNVSTPEYKETLDLEDRRHHLSPWSPLCWWQREKVEGPASLRHCQRWHWPSRSDAKLPSCKIYSFYLWSHWEAGFCNLWSKAFLTDNQEGQHPLKLVI